MLRLPLSSLLVALASAGCHPPAPASDAGDDVPSEHDAGADDAGGDDAGADAPPPDGGVVDRWAHCPAASEFVGDAAWTQPLVVTEDAVYCARFDESRTLREELDAKAMLRVVAGTYRLPVAPTTAPFFLPSCVWLEGTLPVLTGTGTLSHTADVYDTTTYHRSAFTMPLSAGRYSGDITFPRIGAASADVVLDGRPLAPFGDADS
jgi:hypothetical protein